MGLRKRLQEVIPSSRQQKDTSPTAYEGQDGRAGPMTGTPEPPGSIEEAAAFTVAPRTESELVQHIEHSSGVVQRLEREPPPPEHKLTTSFSTANTHAALREAFRVLAMPEHLAVLTNIVRTEAGVVAKQASSQEALKTTRITAREAFKGSYDAVEEKWQEVYKSLPEHARIYALCAAALAAVFLLGVFLAVWRFVLFGLS